MPLLPQRPCPPEASWKDPPVLRKCGRVPRQDEGPSAGEQGVATLQQHEELSTVDVSSLEVDVRSLVALTSSGLGAAGSSPADLTVMQVMHRELELGEARAALVQRVVGGRAG